MPERFDLMCKWASGVYLSIVSHVCLDGVEVVHVDRLL